MKSIIGNLKSFNRKERFYLVGMALGKPEFRLPKTFRNKVGKELGLQIPAGAYAAMDYHLDWLYASLFLSVAEAPQNRYDRDAGLITGNQEDIDLLVAFRENAKTHLILIEAKGVMSFDNQQLRSKIERFNKIFDDPNVKKANVIPHFAIASPFEPKKLDLSFYPDWLMVGKKLVWIKIPHLEGIIKGKGLVKIVRCKENKKPADDGEYWTVVSERKRQKTTHI